MDIVWQTSANPPEQHDYIFRNGFRYVKPYHFEFISHAKNRWLGKTIVDLLADEFKARDRDYYVSAVKSGQIKVDGCIVPVSYMVRPSQKISHFLHRHEPPVKALDVLVLQKEEDVLTVCKPASIPVHPRGQYRKNTVVGILQAEHNLAPLFPIHRLDRLVSGLLILARSASKADLFRQQQVVDVNVNYNAQEGRSTTEVRENCGNADTPLKGKTACTKFNRISSNGTHSIVLCQPISGRTHQVRVHLQYTGYPIANDMLYLSEFVNDNPAQGLHAYKHAFLKSNSSEEPEEECNEDFTIDPTCTNCPNLGPKGYDRNEEGLWLHCVRYSGPDWVYECPYPDWAVLT